ncbi:competence/damage-inducible protein cinA [Friedmanniella luteola]|uniref:Competence/damage-inducible protein cinA n=1 Tax=Friedmanniella luteola TaxID=546871 RepID=A0A1H1R7Y8_9ACTN|nr:CinA family protein [Friedmanniella luteola]SDS31904.1 competence/damage-inducible protein cinA [Friedmanniella luteola]
MTAGPDVDVAPAPGVDPAAAAALAALAEHGATLATAESLTGGLIGALLTSVPGASAGYVGGVISYATRLKHTLVGVPSTTLDELGPVAAPTARAMAAGVAARCDADWGLAVTGVAGPEPQDGHPVGQVFVGLARPSTGWTKVEELRLSGDRAAIRRLTAQAALTLLTAAVRNNGAGSGR